MIVCAQCVDTKESLCLTCRHGGESMLNLPIHMRVHAHHVNTEESSCLNFQYKREFMLNLSIQRRVHAHRAKTEESSCLTCRYGGEPCKIVFHILVITFYFDISFTHSL